MRNMVRRNLPSEVLTDYNMLSADLHRRLDELSTGMRIALSDPESLRLLAASRRSRIAVDVRELGTEVVVAADLPGSEKEEIHVRLLDPRFLQISIEHREKRTEETEKYHVKERSVRERSRTVLLPADVTTEGSSSTFRNGVLELHLKKAVVKKGTEIPVS